MNQRRRVLISAYGCAPGRGSEPGAGWAWVRAAALEHDVTLLTREKNRAAIEAAVAGIDLRVTVEGLELNAAWLWAKAHGLPDQAYYWRWQHLAGKRALKLHAERPFDIAHHLTWAVDWMPAGVLAVDAPVRIWGPVGGSTSAPLSTYRWLGVRGIVSEVLRELVTRPSRAVNGRRAARRASLVVLQNPDGQKYFSRHATCVVEPNVVVPEIPAGDRDTHARRRAVFVGRLAALKGVAAAVEALTRPAAARWDLDIIGDGPDAKRLRRRVLRRGLEGRVHFRGSRPRAEVLRALREADALLFPSTHDAAGFVVAEAVTAGLPVVCLDHGGPPTIMIEGHGQAVPPGPALADRLAAALYDLPPPTTGSDKWTEVRLPSRLRRLYSLAHEAAQESSVVR